MSTITIYHNPACGTSRNALSLLREHGIEPTVIEYMKTLPSKDKLKALIRDMGISARDLLRQNETAYQELDLANAKWSDDELVDFMLGRPELINRPIVVAPAGTRLCRPAETVLDILE